MNRKELKDIFEIIDYMNKNSNFSEGYYLDEARLIDEYSDCKAILKNVEIKELKPKQDLTQVYQEKINKYTNLNYETSPPILVKNGVIIDGHHRYYSFINNGIDIIQVYELIEIF